LVHASRRRGEAAAIAALGVAVAERRSWEGGSEPLVLPPVAPESVTVVARALVRIALPGVSPAISQKRRLQLEAAARRIDRLSGPGAWLHYALDVVLGWQDGVPGPFLTEPPRSLGALAVELRREANLRRYGHLRRKRERLRPLAASTERQKVKRWRRDLRELERQRPGSGRTLRRPREL
jgi:hypothetical protein